MKNKIVNPQSGDTATFLSTSAQTKGNFTELEYTVIPGGGIFMHVHRTFDETFTALDGELGLKHNKETIILTPGDTMKIPKGEMHSFFNPGSDEIRFRILLEPGNEGFENALRIGFGLSAEGKTDKHGIPRNFQIASLLIDMSDINVIGIYQMFSPLMKFAANRARRKGIEKELIAKYCR